MKPAVFFLALLTACPAALRADGAQEEKRVKVEWEIDPYYTSVGLYSSLTDKPIPQMGEKTEWEIYKELARKFYLPRTLIVEASINPMPAMGAELRRVRPEFYQSMKVNRNLNVVKAVTAGFEEPWAFSFFLGNVIAFESARQAYRGKRHGYTGFLVDVGNFHIKDNVLIPDEWVQVEWKLKGEQFLKERALRWSFRWGVKFHGNREISDTFFVAFRRSRTDHAGAGSFFLNNSGFEYVFDMARHDLEGLRHYFLLNKKLPSKTLGMTFTLAAGFVWTADKKYFGSLSNNDQDHSRFQLIARPSVEF